MDSRGRWHGFRGEYTGETKRCDVQMACLIAALQMPCQSLEKSQQMVAQGIDDIWQDG
jgi:hypothetical protein